MPPDHANGKVATLYDEEHGLTPLIYNNVNPYGLIRLNMAERLAIERAEAV